MQPEKGRLSSLDGLRGIAAMAVVAEHCLLTDLNFWSAFQSENWRDSSAPQIVNLLSFTPLRLFWAGSPAVAIFFVLSGFVLSMPFWRSQNIGYWGYAVRRIFRLFPVYILSLLLAEFLYLCAHGAARSGMSDWYSRYWVSPIGLDGWGRAMFFMPGNALQLNSPLWTLIHEARISLMLPCIIVLMRKRPLATVLACVAFSFAGKAMMANARTFGPEIANVLDTVAQVWLFALGCLLSKNLSWIRNKVEGGAGWLNAALLGASLVGLVLKWMVPLPAAVGYAATGISAAGLVLMVSAWRALQKALEGGGIQFLGTISYPLYAIHFPLLFWLLHALPQTQAFLVIALAVSLAIVGATILSKTVEPASIAYGRRLSDLLQGERGERARGAVGQEGDKCP